VPLLLVLTSQLAAAGAGARLHLKRRVGDADLIAQEGPRTSPSTIAGVGWNRRSQVRAQL
jgi:hypothetical protein